MKRSTVRALGLLLFATLAGCGDSKQIVTGTVTLDDKPVAKGSITFISTEGELVREGAVIEDGRFQTHVPPGKYKIELSGTKVKGKRTQKGMDGKDEEIIETEELFPEKYSSKTELVEEIKRGPNEIKLNLKSTK